MTYDTLKRQLRSFKFKYTDALLYYKTGVNAFNYSRSESTDENGTISYVYKAPNGKDLVSISDVKGLKRVVAYEYDTFGNLIRVIHPNAINADNNYR